MRDLSKHLTNAKIVGENISQSVYVRQEARRGEKDFIMSRGELCEFMTCPSRWLNGAEPDETKATEWGTLIDCLALTPSKFDELFAVTPETYPSEGKGKVIEQKPWNWNATFCKEWRDGLGDKTAIKPDVKAEADRAVATLFEDEKIAELLDGAKTQVMVTAEYKDADTKIVVPLKGLIDIVPSGNGPYGVSLADLKTCNFAGPGAWPKVVYEYGYNVQAALYLDMFVAATGEPRIDFLHVLQESSPPYQTGRRLLSSEFIELGRHQYISALKRYCRCLAEGVWPGYDDEGPNVLNGWQLTQPSAYMIGA